MQAHSWQRYEEQWRAMQLQHSRLAPNFEIRCTNSRPGFSARRWIWEEGAHGDGEHAKGSQGSLHPCVVSDLMRRRPAAAELGDVMLQPLKLQLVMVAELLRPG